jgi:hypothetical protein
MTHPHSSNNDLDDSKLHPINGLFYYYPFNWTKNGH